jgi:hypothetical protein
MKCFFYTSNFQCIEALDAVDCTIEHLNIAKYAQILVQYKSLVRNFKNLKKNANGSYNCNNYIRMFVEQEFYLNH